MAKMPTPRIPKAPKMPTPKASAAMAPIRRPVASGGGKDIISITTRMRETPSKKG